LAHSELGTIVLLEQNLSIQGQGASFFRCIGCVPLGLEAKRRIQQRLINFVKEQVPATIQ